MKTVPGYLLILLIIAVLTGCSQASEMLLPDPDKPPATLAGWGQLVQNRGQLTPANRVQVYDLNTPLFTDYAHKFRTLWLPDGQQMNYRDDDSFDFPVGAVITKTFFYPQRDGQLLKTADISRDYGADGLALNAVRLIETRVLFHTPAGWRAFPYIWNEDQTEARLETLGDIKALTLMDG
ncbi:MAG: hypothetical protein KDI36_02540, partial [Pseudomonadales bacterium]|nr:hypothetical protein [Pseudomonadales bacterium]